jgi:hypothetical protein
MRVSQGRGLRCRWELSPIGDSERALRIMIYSKLSLDLLPLVLDCLGLFAEPQPDLGVFS